MHEHQNLILKIFVSVTLLVLAHKILFVKHFIRYVIAKNNDYLKLAEMKASKIAV